MSNYIALIEIYIFDATCQRRTQMNLRNVVITDLDSARKAIDRQLKIDGFKFTKRERDSYYITMLAKVDEAKK